MFKCIISHSSTKSFIPWLHKFTIQKLNLSFFFFGKLNLLNITVYLLTFKYFGRMEKKLSRRKAGLHFADFSWFELRRYVMKGKSKGNFWEVISIVHWSGSTNRLLLQDLGWWCYGTGQNVSVTKKQTSHPVYSKRNKK